jgi:nucleotide-binding universal stress UspA family protein
MPMFPTRIVVGVDRSESSRVALRAASELARATSSQLHLVHVKRTSSHLRGRPLTPAQGDEMDAEAAALLAEARATVEQAGGAVAEAHVRFGQHIDRALVAVQDELDAGLLVIGSSADGSVARSLLAAPETGAVRRSGGSVLVAR